MPVTRQQLDDLIITAYNYYKKHCPYQDREVFWMVLSGYEKDDIERAIRKHYANPKNGTFLPRVADLVNYLPEKPKETTIQACSDCKTKKGDVHCGPPNARYLLCSDCLYIHQDVNSQTDWKDTLINETIAERNINRSTPISDYKKDNVINVQAFAQKILSDAAVHVADKERPPPKPPPILPNDLFDEVVYNTVQSY